MAGADDRESFVGGEMRKGFFESAGERGELGGGSNAQNGLAEAEDAVSGVFEGLRRWVVGGTGDNNLNGMTGKERGGEAVGCSEEAVLWGDAGESFERFLGE